jgi:hypothetical protein
MFNSITRKATAFGLAAALTFVLLSSINLLAAPPAADSVLASNSAPMQVVVIEAKRLPRG